ncbi:MAG TPA: hypothetical protein EYP10_02965, partial [Armatimonadetes bacterium]|nr:hypothetical protein [Armatimonadota bacterium]
MKQWVTAVCANRKLYVVACIVLVIAISTAIVWHCSHRLRIVKSTKRKVAEDVRMELQHVKELKIRKRGETIWELSIEVVKVNKARTRVQIKGLKRGIYYQNGKPLLEISAQHALWDMVTDDIEVWGGVTARTPSGLVIRTNKVMWRDSDAVLECPQRVIGESEKLRFVALRVSSLPHKN